MGGNGACGTAKCLPSSVRLLLGLIKNHRNQDTATARYFVSIRVGIAAGGAGEITKVSQIFQPSGRCSLANSP